MKEIRPEYIFYFFSDKFNTTTPFINLYVTDTNWGRYDKLSIEQYGEPDYYWVIMIMDSRQTPWEMKYEYTLFLPSKIDLLRYMDYIDQYVIGRNNL